MNADRLMAHFERISDAPNAVGRLRRFVLDLAVRGKLVEQDPGESAEPSKAPAAEEPFPLPLNWSCVALGGVLRMINGRAFKPSEWLTKGLPIVRIQNLNNESAMFNCCDPKSVDEKNIIESSTFLISWSGTPGTSFGAFIWQRGRAALNQHIFKCLPNGTEYLDRFLQLAINGRLDEIIAKSHGGVGLQHITKGKLEALALPLPPLAEQHRIVEKVNELMMLCDRLEASQAERESRTDRLVVASLNRLSQPTAPDEFKKDARFQLSHLSRLSTKPEHIKEIRKAILNLAVRGKLVPQDGREQPFTDHTSDGGDPERRLDMELPAGWRWVQVRDVGDSRLGKMLDKAKNRGKPYRYLRNTNVHWFEIRLEDIKTMPLAAEEANTFLLAPGDVLICEGGHGIARTAVWRGDGEDMAFQKALHRVRPGKSLSGDFLAHCIRVYFDEGVLQRLYTGVGIPHFTGVALSKLIFPLPPLAEQKRIVAKVDELMLICDQLENQLESQQKGRRQLLEALLHEALEGVG